jgi:hypothetical protein
VNTLRGLNWFFFPNPIFAICLNFQQQNPLKYQYLPHLSSKTCEINSSKSDLPRAFQQHQEHPQIWIQFSVSILFSFHWENGSRINNFSTIAPNSFKPSQCTPPYSFIESFLKIPRVWHEMPVVWEISALDRYPPCLSPSFLLSVTKMLTQAYFHSHSLLSCTQECWHSHSMNSMPYAIAPLERRLFKCNGYIEDFIERALFVGFSNLQNNASTYCCAMSWALSWEFQNLVPHKVVNILNLQAPFCSAMFLVWCQISLVVSQTTNNNESFSVITTSPSTLHLIKWFQCPLHIPYFTSPNILHSSTITW